jgi:hypothetical protein
MLSSEDWGRLDGQFRETREAIGKLRGECKEEHDKLHVRISEHVKGYHSLGKTLTMVAAVLTIFITTWGLASLVFQALEKGIH